MTRGPLRQRGATLVMALIFLVLLSLFAVNAFLGATSGQRIVGNMQSRQESQAAAQTVIEQVLSSEAFARQPAAVASAPVTVTVGGVAYTVRLTPPPSCYRVRTVKNSELDATIAGDRSCMRSGSLQQPGVEQSSAQLTGQVADTSLCADTEWNIRAQVTDGRTGAQMAVHQGVAIRMAESDANLLCQ